MSIRRNALLNMAGHAAPLAAAVALVPSLVANLGVERFGFLAIAWVLVGYFSLFDLGLGRTLARLIAERRGSAREAELPVAARSALGLALALGVAVGLFLFLSAGLLCRNVLTLSEELERQGTVALRILALGMPAVIATSALRGILEAVGRFDWVNAIRIPLGVLSFGAPLAVAHWTVDLGMLAAALVVVRVIAFAAHWSACRSVCPAYTSLGRIDRAAGKEMSAYGGWLTVSNVVGPVMVYLDRFVIGSLVAVAAVAFYTAPYEVVTRLWLVPAALTGVLFPAMAQADPQRLRVLYRKGLAVVAAAVVPLALAMALSAPMWLDLWLGAEFATHGTVVAQLLCIGAAVNSLAYLPFTLLQARGYAHLTAKAHAIELPLYVLVLWLLVRAIGIEGAALAWSLRCAADALAMFVLARRHSGALA